MKQNRKSRSVQATQEGLKQLKKAKATQRNDRGRPLTYENIADKAGLNEKTVKNFFLNKRVDRDSAFAIAHALDLEITEIVDPEDWEPAEATEADATPAANAENSITPTTPNTPIMGRLSVVPKIPENLLRRDREIAAVKKLLLSDTKQPVAIAGQSRQVGIQGMGGIGKSTLAAIVAHDQEVRRRFPDGIFWQPLGQNPSLRLRQLDLCKTLGDPAPQFEDVQGGKVHLRELLKNKTCLLILDDVWHVDDADAFNVLSSSSQLLLTTRNLEPIHGLNAQEFQLSILSDTQAQAMLATYADQHLENLPTITHEIARECGNLPLALAMIGAQMRGKPENRWDNLLNKLRKADLEKIRFEFADYPYPDLFKAIQVSVEELEAEEQKRYLDFAVFPEDTPIPEAVLQTFWQLEGLDQYDTQDMVDRLVNLSLAQRDNQERLTLHDLQYDYVRKQAGDLSVLHNRLLNAYAAKCENGWHTGPNDGYFFEHLANHLLAAGKKSELRQLLFNFQWLEAKLNATDVNALIADYELLSDDPDLRLIKEAIQLSAHILIDDKNKLLVQLLGRLLSFDSPHIQAFLKEAKPSLDIPWIRPLTSIFVPPGGSLQGVLIGHKDKVSAIAITPDGKHIVSGSYDQTIKIWDLATRKELRTLTGHKGRISKIAITPDGQQIYSASPKDKTVKVWNFQTGQEINNFLLTFMDIDNDDKTNLCKLTIILVLHLIPEHQQIVYSYYHRSSIFNKSEDDIKIFTVWDLQTGQIVRNLNETEYDNQFNDNQKVIFLLEIQKKIEVLKKNHPDISLIAITPDQKLLVTGSSNRVIKIWNLEHLKLNEKPVKFQGHDDQVSTIAVSPDNQLVFSASNDKTIKIWDLFEQKEIKKIHTDYQILGFGIYSNTQLAFFKINKDCFKIYDIENDREQEFFDRELGSIAAVSSTGQLAISEYDDLIFYQHDDEPDLNLIIKLWNLKEKEKICNIDEYPYTPDYYAISKNEKFAIVSSFDMNFISCWDIYRNHELWSLSWDWIKTIANKYAAYESFLTDFELVAIDIINNGKKAIIYCNFNYSDYSASYFIIFNITKNYYQTIQVFHSLSECIISSDERLLFASGAYWLSVWDLETLELITKFSFEGNISTLAVAPDNRTIIVGEESGRLHFLRLEGL